jgi:hypothetical protein
MASVPGYLIFLDASTKCSHIGHSKMRRPRSRLSGIMLATLISQPHREHGRRAIGWLLGVMGWNSGMSFHRGFDLFAYANLRQMIETPTEVGTSLTMPFLGLRPLPHLCRQLARMGVPESVKN